MVSGLVSGVLMGVCLCISGLPSDDIIIPWEPTKQADFMA